MQVAVGGIMRSLVAYDRGESFVPVHFARVNDRDGFLLLGRAIGFDWPDLAGKRLIVFGEAPTPWRVCAPSCSTAESTLIPYCDRRRPDRRRRGGLPCRRCRFRPHSGSRSRGS